MSDTLYEKQQVNVGFWQQQTRWGRDVSDAKT